MTAKKKSATKKWQVNVAGCKANAKRFDNRDGLRKQQMENEIRERFNPDDNNESLEMLRLHNYYPLLALGIGEHEGFEMPMTEEIFWGLPEEFVLEMSEQIQEENPQYAVPFSVFLQGMLKTLKTSDTEPLLSSMLPDDKNDKTRSKSDS